MTKYIYEGRYHAGKLPVYVLEDDRLYDYYAYIGHRLPLYTIRDGKFYEGVITTSTPEYTMVGNKLYEGIPHGQMPLYEINGDYVYRVSGRLSGAAPEYCIEDQ